MTKGTIREKIKAVEQSHSKDRDGGYALLRALHDLSVSLGQEDRDKLLAVLLDLVTEYDPTLWGVALEFLVQEKVLSIVGVLEPKLRSVRPGSWGDHVLHALLRLGWTTKDRFCQQYFSEALAAERFEVLPILATWCKESPDALENASRFLASSLASGDREKRIEGYVPAFVRSLRDDPDALLELASTTKAIDPEAGSRLIRMIQSYLQRQYVRRELGDRSDAISARLREV